MTPTLALKFSDLILRTAEFLGVADYSGGIAAIPTDVHDLELCRRLVNDGYRRAVNSHPRGKWNCMAPLHRIEFVTGVYSYTMPGGFRGDVVGPWTYVDQGYGQGPESCPEGTIRDLRSRNDSSGTPQYVAIRPTQATHAATTDRWEAIFWPTPDAAISVEVKVQLWPNAMTNVDDYHVLGAQHDGLILAAALAETEAWKGGGDGSREQRFLARLGEAILLDTRSAPMQINPERRPRNRMTNEMQYNGVTVSDLA